VNVIVLVPDVMGYVVYLRTPGDRLRRCDKRVEKPEDLRAWTRWTKTETVVVLIGYRFANEIADVALANADFVVVPMPWMRGLPSHATAKRAARAAHLAMTQLATPIDLRFADGFHGDIPF